MTDDPRTLEQLEQAARDLEIEGRSSMDKAQLAEAVDAENARRGQPTTKTSAAVPPPAPAPSPPSDPEPASPDDPTDGRPPLAQIAEDQAANTHVRVYSDAPEDN